VVHIDATLVRADVSWDAIARRHAGAVAAANGDEGQGRRPSAARRRPPAAGDPPAEPGPGRAAVCTTDPGATLVKNRQARRSEPADKQHTAVDGRAGVVPDVAVTTGAAHETTTVEAQLDAVPAVTGRPVRLATMDAAYAITRVFAALEGRAVEAAVPTKAEPSGRRAASSRSAGSSWTPGTGSYAARANASCARTASPTARDSKPTAPR
jgi:DDE family transposase